MKRGQRSCLDGSGEKKPQRRGTEVTKAIFKAALDLAAAYGLDNVSIESVAAYLGMAKSTLYRRWPNISVLLTDAVLFEVVEVAALQERRRLRDTFVEAMKAVVTLYKSPRGVVLRALLGRAQSQPNSVTEVLVQWVEPRRKIGREMIHKAIENGELSSRTDADVLMDCLFGPIYHRLLIPYAGADLNDEFIDKIADIVFGGIASTPTPQFSEQSRAIEMKARTAGKPKLAKASRRGRNLL